MSRFHKGEETLSFCQRAAVTGYLEAGSALKFALLSEGLIDFYPRLGRVSEWDIAAGHSLLRESGCELIELDRRSYPLYNSKDLIVPGFIAAPAGSDILNSGRLKELLTGGK